MKLKIKQTGIIYLTSNYQNEEHFHLIIKLLNDSNWTALVTHKPISQLRSLLGFNPHINERPINMVARCFLLMHKIES